MGRSKEKLAIGDEAFPDHFLEAFTKIVQMFIGEVDYAELVFGEWDPKWPNVTDVQNMTWPGATAGPWASPWPKSANFSEQEQSEHLENMTKYFNDFNKTSFRLGSLFFVGFI